MRLREKQHAFVCREDFTQASLFLRAALGCCDFNDQLAYDIGKHRFVNRHLHWVLVVLRPARGTYVVSAEQRSDDAYFAC